MKTILIKSSWILLVAVVAVRGYSDGLHSFDVCILDPNVRSSNLNYRQAHWHESEVIGGVTAYVKDTFYARTKSGFKIVKQYEMAKDQSFTNDYEILIKDGPFVSPNFWQELPLRYECGLYQGSHADWINAYLDGDDVSGGYGDGITVDIHEDGGAHSSVAFAVTLTATDSDPDDGIDFPGEVWKCSLELDGGFMDDKLVNDGKDHGPCGQCPNGGGMPVWFVTEPYINLWIQDKPVFYTSSLGEEISFEVMFKQRDTRPINRLITSVPITGWQHNWFSYISFQVPTIITGTNSNGYETNGAVSSRGAIMRNNWVITNDFSQWQAILYARDGGENYFDSGAMTEASSGLRVFPMDGTSVDSGFRLVHPDGSQEIYSRITQSQAVYGQEPFRGKRACFASGGDSDMQVDTLYVRPWATNHYTEFNNASYEPPLGTIGYLVKEALMTERIDPFGNTIHLTYDASNRLVNITDYDGRSTVLTYDGDLLTNVDMQYGKTAQFNYTNGLLVSITDAAGMTSSMTYAQFGGFEMPNGSSLDRTNYIVNSLTTPYGTTSFSHYQAGETISITNPPHLRLEPGSLQTDPAFTTNSSVGGYDVYANLHIGHMGGSNRVNRACTVTHPDGSKELYAYRYDSANLVPPNYASAEIPYSVPNASFDDGSGDGSGGVPEDARLTSRNSFHWNRQQTAVISSIDLNHLTPGQIALSRMSHWLADPADPNTLSDSVALVREPSPDGSVEGVKTWFSYSGKPTCWQASSSIGEVTAARVMPDGSVSYRKEGYRADGLLESIAETYSREDCSIGERNYSLYYDDLTAPEGFHYSRLNSFTWPDGWLNRYFSGDGLRMDQVDDLGYSNVLTFNTRHQITSLARANGLTTTWSYGVNGFLAKRIDLQANATNTYAFNGGQLRTNTNPLGLVTSYTWDYLDRLLTSSFPDGTTIENRYDKLNLTGQKDRLGNWVTTGYNNMGQLSVLTDANSNVTHYTWCNCGALESITDPLNHTTTFSRDQNGNVITATTDGGFSTTYHRNTIGQVTNVTSSAGLDLDYHYNIQGLVTNISSPVGAVYSAVYDIRDRPVSVTDARGIAVERGFDSIGRIVSRSDTLSHIETFTYTAQGLSQFHDSLNHVTSYGYDSAGRLTVSTNANLEVTQCSYNPLGGIASLTDGRNYTKRWAYDEYGRRTRETNAVGLLVRTNGYDANGRLTKLWTAAKGLASLDYDANGNLRSITYPTTGARIYSYDALNRLAGVSNGVGSISFSYATFGAFDGPLASEDGPWANDTVSYSYADQKLTSVSLGDWSETIGYDAALRPQTLTTPAGTFMYHFNSASRQVGSLSMPQNVVTNDFNEIGELIVSRLKQGGTVLESHSYGYDAAGLITGVTRFNGVIASYGYDPIGQLVIAQAFESGNAPRLHEQLGYSYDASHSLTARTNNTLLQTFTSNEKNELVNVARSGVLTVAGSVTGAIATLSVNGSWAQIYSDQSFATTNGLTINDGNNLFVTAGSNAAGTLVLSTMEARKLPVAVSFRYDLNGNLLSDGAKGYDYDDGNQLIRITATNSWKSEFGYDGLGRRRVAREFTWTGTAWSLTNETRYVWDGMTVLQERDGNNAVQVTYTRGLDLSGTRQGAGGIGGLLARTDANGSTYYHHDAGGNVTAMTDGNGNIVARYLYDPFGNLLAKSGTMAEANRYRFSSKEMHANSGLYYYGFRYYEPNLQRWLNEDPIGEWGGMNLYGFVGNGPLGAIDPYGFWWSPSDLGHDWAQSVAEGGEMLTSDGTGAGSIAWNTAVYAFTGLGESVPDLLNFGEALGAASGDPNTSAKDWAKAGFRDTCRGLGLTVAVAGPIARGASTVARAAGLDAGAVGDAGVIATSAENSVANTANAVKNCSKAAEGTAMRNVVQFQGMEVRAVRDLSHLDQGTLEAMEEVGFAPRTVNGEQISLHHLNQNPAGPLVEMPRGNNLVGNTVQHPFGNTAGAGLTDAQRAAYNAWRTDYWKWRATQELNLRRVVGN